MSMHHGFQKVERLHHWIKYLIGVKIRLDFIVNYFGWREVSFQNSEV